jgi:NAD(P)H-flavin reductase
MVPSPFAVRERTQETADTWTLELEPAAGEPLPVAPGQFVMVYAFGIGEVPVSVSALPLVLTVRAVGAVTAAICASEPGSILGIRGPFGNSWPVEAARGGDLVVVAGGIGLAPLRGAIRQALEERSAFGEVSVLYGARTPGDLLYRDELERWRETAAVDVTVDAADSSWPGRVGVVPKLIPSARFEPASATALVVGPEIMMRFTVEALLARHIPAERIFLSLERNMRCGLGHCGHCQLGPTLICLDGPVYPYSRAAPWLEVREL